MGVNQARVANFIIGGTEKAGTTSVFTYLGEHPEVCGALSKETDFFRQESSGDLEKDLENYSKFFSRCNTSVPYVMEASPGYLGEAFQVVPRMAALVPEVKLLFILRDPIERMYSSYNFHVGKLNIPEDISFEAYVDKCIRFDGGLASPAELGVEEWYLKVLKFGRYADFLAPYYDAFPSGNIKVMFFEQLRDDVAGFMDELSGFLGIDAEIWKQYEFRKTNVTFSGSNKLLHKAAIYFNSISEPILRQRPRLKRTLVDFYKKINQAREGYDPMSEQAQAALQEYYASSNASLRTLLARNLPPSWEEVPEKAAV